MSACKIVVMGVAGCGKSAVGSALAQELGAVWRDGDDLHPVSNVEKMRSGQPLTDADRAPWLKAVGQWLAKPGARVVGCSALRRGYRDLLRAQAGPGLFFVHLEGSRALIAARMAARNGHFMPTSLLDSQFQTLEPLSPDETGCVVQIDAPLSTVVQAARDAVRRVRS